MYITGYIVLISFPFMTSVYCMDEAFYPTLISLFATIISYSVVLRGFAQSKDKMYELIEGGNMEKTKDEQVAMPTVAQIDLPKLDIEQYIGKKVKIDKADVYKSNKFGGHYVKVETKIVDTLGKGDKKIELRGSRIFGLQEDENGKVGFGKDTKLGVFMTKMKATKLIDLIGKDVVLQSQTNDNGMEFLTFN
jgi:hypothetical protein